MHIGERSNISIKAEVKSLSNKSCYFHLALGGFLLLGQINSEIKEQFYSIAAKKFVLSCFLFNPGKSIATSIPSLL